MSEITVTVVGSTGVTTSITSPDSVNVSTGTAFQASVPSLLVLGGKNVTVTTTSGTFTVASADAPVTSVNGRTGAVSVTRSELGAAPLSHTHTASQVTDFATEAAKYGPVTAVAGVTGAVGLVAGTNITLTTSSSSITISAAGVTATGLTAAVTKLNNLTGTLSIVAGSNVTVSTSASTLTISAGGGGGNAFAMTYLFGG